MAERAKNLYRFFYIYTALYIVFCIYFFIDYFLEHFVKNSVMPFFSCYHIKFSRTFFFVAKFFKKSAKNSKTIFFQSVFCQESWLFLIFFFLKNSLCLNSQEPGWFPLLIIWVSRKPFPRNRFQETVSCIFNYKT